VKAKIRTMTVQMNKNLPTTEVNGKNTEVVRNHAAFIWSVADLLRGDYKQSEYGKVILPLTVIRRLDCVLEPTKAGVLKRYQQVVGKIDNYGPVLEAVVKQQFFNTSPLDFRKLLDDPTNIADNLRSYIAAFSDAAKDVIDRFAFGVQITRLDHANLLYRVIGAFADIDLHPDVVSNLEMGYLYEELIRRFSELSNETAGEHFTPREVIRLMVNLLFIEDEDVLTKPGTVRTLFDPACGTGGMLSVAEDHLRDLNPAARLEVYGQELNDETYAICRSDMMLKGQDASHIVPGNSFSDDGHQGARFDYLLANPPFGVEWKKVEDVIRKEAATKGFHGRFGAGLPRINDGSLLFLQHMISKMKPASEGGSRLAIIFNGSPLFSGAAGSGESEIRRWIIENDWLEAVVALPDQLFYNTGISTYFWIVTNRKSPERRGMVQLVDARDSWTKMRKSLGNKRKEFAAEQINEVTRLYGDFIDGKRVKIVPNEAFGYMRTTVDRPLRLRWLISDETISVALAEKKLQKLSVLEREACAKLLGDFMGQHWSTEKEALGTLRKPLSTIGVEGTSALTMITALGIRDPEAPPVTDRTQNAVADPELRDGENVPLPQVGTRYEHDPAGRLSTLPYQSAIEDHVRDEVLPYVPDAWVDLEKTKIGYEIPFTQYFYTHVSHRPLEDIDIEIKALEADIQNLLAQFAGQR
jgi:type I restriction enzyme M protein